MIVAKKEYLPAKFSVYGNYALDNKRYYEEDEVNVALKRNKQEKHKKQIILRFKMVSAVILVFLNSIFIISRYAAITNLKNQSIDLSKMISVQQKENENLKIQLMKFNDIMRIEKVATTELKMVQPGKSDNLRVSINVDNEQKEEAVDGSKSDKGDLVNRLKDIFNHMFF